MSNYQPGNFIELHEYGIGQVIEVHEGHSPELEIHFKDHGTRRFTEHLINRNASRRSPDGFHAFMYLEPDQAKQLLLGDPVGVVCKVLEDFPGRRAKTDDIKKYLSPYIEEMDKWWKTTQALLKENHRIDSTKSHLREYGIREEELPPLQAAYRSFSRYRAFESFPMVYDQARRVLRELEKGGTLKENKFEDLLTYFRHVIVYDGYPIGERLDAFFRLMEGKWLSPEQTQTQLAELLRARFRIYDLDLYSQPRLVKYLIERRLDDESLELLATGMCGQASVVNALMSWAIRKSDPSIITRLIITALSENLPPKLGEDKYKDLKARLVACVELVRCLSVNGPNWPGVFKAFNTMNRAIGAVPDLTTIKYLLQSLVTLAWELHLRALQHDLDENIILDGLTDPGLRIEYILLLLETIPTAGLPVGKSEQFSEQLQNRLLATADKRGDDFLLPLISMRWDSPIKQAAGLAEFIERCPSKELIERAGRVLCEIGKQAKEAELVNLLPYLDSFHRLEGKWNWSNSLEGLREKAYSELFHSTTKPAREPLYQDLALGRAVQQHVKLQLAALEQIIREQKERLAKYQVRITELENLLKEKETVLRELRGSAGGDTKEGRFEERIRIMKELVGTIAEFERYAASQPTRSKEIEAVLRRLENLVSSYKVVALEPIGAKVEFSLQKHRLTEGGDLSPGEPVIIVERGFLIRDSQDRLRLLKPALVKKT